MDQQAIFDKLCLLLKKHSKGLELTHALANSTAKVKKPTLILQSKNDISILNRPPQKTFVASAMMQKGYVGFYFMPIYGAPRKFMLSPALKKLLKGKACFHVKTLDAPLKKELDRLLADGIKCFKKLGYL